MMVVAQDKFDILKSTNYIFFHLSIQITGALLVSQPKYLVYFV